MLQEHLFRDVPRLLANRWGPGLSKEHLGLYAPAMHLWVHRPESDRHWFHCEGRGRYRHCIRIWSLLCPTKLQLLTMRLQYPPPSSSPGKGSASSSASASSVGSSRSSKITMHHHHHVKQWAMTDESMSALDSTHLGPKENVLSALHGWGPWRYRVWLRLRIKDIRPLFPFDLWLMQQQKRVNYEFMAPDSEVLFVYTVHECMVPGEQLGAPFIGHHHLLWTVPVTHSQNIANDVDDDTVATPALV